MAIFFNLDPSRFVKGFRAGREDTWDDAERADKLRQSQVKTNFLEGTAATALDRGNAENVYATGNANRENAYEGAILGGRIASRRAKDQYDAAHANRENEYEGAVQGNRILAGNASLRNQAGNSTRAEELGEAAHPGMLAGTQYASDEQVETAERNRRAGNIDLGARVTADGNRQRLLEEQARQREYDPLTVGSATGRNQTTVGVQTADSAGNAARVAGQTMGDAAASLLSPEIVKQFPSLPANQITNILKERGVIPQGYSVIDADDGTGNIVRVVRGNDGGMVPLDSFIAEQQARARQAAYESLSPAQLRAQQQQQQQRGAGTTISPITGEPITVGGAGMLGGSADEAASGVIPLASPATGSSSAPSILGGSTQTSTPLPAAPRYTPVGDGSTVPAQQQQQQQQQQPAEPVSPQDVITAYIGTPPESREAAEGNKDAAIRALDQLARTAQGADTQAQRILAQSQYDKLEKAVKDKYVADLSMLKEREEMQVKDARLMSYVNQRVPKANDIPPDAPMAYFDALYDDLFRELNGRDRNAGFWGSENYSSVDDALERSGRGDIVRARQAKIQEELARSRVNGLPRG